MLFRVLELGFDLAEQFAHGRSQSLGDLTHDENRRHSFAAFEQSDVIAMQLSFRRQSLLGQASGLPSSAQDNSEMSLKRMHGSTRSLYELNHSTREGLTGLHTTV